MNTMNANQGFNLAHRIKDLRDNLSKAIDNRSSKSFVLNKPFLLLLIRVMSTKIWDRPIIGDYSQTQP
jgi:hypothetical protein